MARRDTGSFAFDENVGVLSGNEAQVYFELGLKWSSGREAAVDYVEAHKWFNIAALKGHLDARRNRTEIAREMTRQQISKAQARARKWLNS